MKTRSDTNAVITTTASLLTIVIGCVVVAGWLFGIASFKSLIAGFYEMKFSTAICFILSGTSLYFINTASPLTKARNITIAICSWLVLAIGLGFLSQYIFSGLDINKIFWKENGPFTILLSPRMTLIVSFNFTLLGFIFLVLKGKKKSWLAQVLLMAVIPGSLLVILNHLFGLSFLNSIPLQAPTSLHTALLFLILAIGIFFSPAMGFLQFSFVKKMAAFFVLILLFRGLVFFAINRNNLKDSETDKIVEHTHVVLALAEQMNLKVSEIDRKTKGSVISGDTTYHSYITESEINLKRIIDSLRQATGNDAGQPGRVDSLQKNTVDLLDFEKKLSNTTGIHGLRAVGKSILSGKGDSLINKINSIISAIEHAENKMLAIRKVNNLKSIRNTSQLLTLFQVIVVLMFLVALKMIYNNSRYRNKVEGALTKSLKDISDYKHALDESSILVITDHDGIIRQVNDNFCKIARYDREELIGRDHRIINSGHHTKEFMRDLWVTINNGEIWRGEIKNRAKDGTYFWLDTTIVPFMNNHGKPYQYVAIRSDITQRKKLEEEINRFNKELQERVVAKTREVIEKDQQYRFLLQNMREGIQIIGFDWRYIFVNDSASQQGNYSNEKLVGYTVMEKNPGIENTAFFKALKRCMEDRTSDILENKFMFPDGIERWFELSIQPVPKGLFILSMDITEKKKAKQALTESENYLRTIIETEPECVKLLNCRGELLDMNSAGLSIIEADSLEQVKGKTVLGLVKPAYRDQFKEMVQNVFKGMSQKVEFELVGFKGSHRWLETNAVPIKSGDGKIISLLSVTRDVTDRKRAEQKLRESLERYELVNKATRDTIWEWDMATNEFKWNDVFTTLYGYNKDDNEKKYEPGYQNIHPSDRERIMQKIKTCCDNKLDYWQEEYRFRAADGTYRDVYDRAFVQYGDDGQPRRMVGAMTDLTEKKRLEKELAGQRMKQQKLLTEVAIQTQEKEKNELGKELHDNINQILSTVKIYLGMLKNGQVIIEDDLVGKSYEYISTAIDELRKLSHSLVAPSLGEVELEEALLQLVDDTRVIDKLKVQLTVERSYKKHQIDKNIELMFYRIAQEQLNNIIKYSGATNVVINVAVNDLKVMLSVSDNGVGFDVSKKTKGIGLKNINNRVAFYSGSMKVISEPGKGCTLEVSIPVEAGKAANSIHCKDIQLLQVNQVAS